MGYPFKHLLSYFVVTVILMGSSGCGYGFRVSGAPVGIKIDSLAIPLFESTSTDTGFESEFTDVIRNEFINRSKVPIVAKDQAQVVISGRIYKIDTKPISYDTKKQSVEGNTVSYETDGTRKLIVRADITMTDRATGKVIWHEDSMEEESLFKVNNDPLQNRYNKDQAIKEIAGLMAKRIYLNTMERF